MTDAGASTVGLWMLLALAVLIVSSGLPVWRF